MPADLRLGLHVGDCVDVLRALPDASVDACVCDPPYDLTAKKNGGSGLASLNVDSPAGRSRITTGFMGKAWDGTGIAFDPETWRLVLRVLKPGAHLIAFGGTRTVHRLACAIEDAGFEIRNGSGVWLQYQGFPKSMDVSRDLVVDGRACRCNTPTHAERDMPSLFGDVQEAVEPDGAVLLSALRRDGEAQVHGGAPVSGLRQGVDADESGAAGSQQDMLDGLRCEDGSGRDARKGAPAQPGGVGDAGVLGVRGDVRAAARMGEGGHGASGVLSFVQRQGPREGAGGPPEARRDVDDRTPGTGAAEIRGRSEPGMEGRGDPEASEGQLLGRAIRALPDGPPRDGSQRRVRDGASADHGSNGSPPAGAFRGGPPPEPPTGGQQASEPGTVAEQQRPQIGGAWPPCGRCGLPMVPWGLGTDLKPAIEHWVLARKPLDGTVAANVLKWGTGGLNIDACRYAEGDPAWPGPWGKPGWNDTGTVGTQAAAGYLGSSTFRIREREASEIQARFGEWDSRFPANVYACPKASRSEREAGLSAGNMLCSCKPRRRTWAGADLDHGTDSLRAASPARAMSASDEAAGSSWPIGGRGSNTTDEPYLSGAMSTTSTGTAETTGSRISPSLIERPISGCTEDANSETARGGSLAASAENSNPSGRSTGIRARRAGRSTDDAGPVTSASSSNPSRNAAVCPDCGMWIEAPTGAQAVEREEGSRGVQNPRAGAGRTAAAVFNLHPT
mgnify:FL=1